MTLDEILKSVNGNSNQSHITIEEAEMVFENDSQLAEKVMKMFAGMILDPRFHVIVKMAAAVEIPPKEFADIVFAAVVENVLNGKEDK